MPVMLELLTILRDARSDVADQCSCDECPVCRAYQKLTKAIALAEKMQ